jgi:hypothetical protein
VNDLIRHAESIARQGFPVFPCLANKAPACEHGFYDATTDLDLIPRLFRSASLIGVRTGIASGIDVLDIDDRHGGYKWLEANHDKIPSTRIHTSRGGGLHLIFKHAPGLRNSTSRIAQGIDVRSEGGSVIWWPAHGFSMLNQSAPAEWPNWLLRQALPPPAPIVPGPPHPVIEWRGYANAALRRASTNVVAAMEGSRNDTLNREAYSLLRFAQTGQLDIHAICETLTHSALQAGLSRTEITRTLASAMKARGFNP